MPPKFQPKARKMPPKHTSKPLPPQIIRPTQQEANTSTSSGLDEESENKFELELCWCIQQFELGISSGKLNDKQMKNTQKNLKLLKSNSVPLIQKRQVMRNNFGDYRDKMLQEEKKHGKTVSTVKFSTGNSTNDKCVFIRKAVCKENTTRYAENNENGELTNDSESTETSNGTLPTQSLSSLFKKNTENEPFIFNFRSPD